MEKFSRFFQDDGTLEDWCNTWADALAGLNGEQLKFGIDRVAKNNPWPPTTSEFRQACEAAPKPVMRTIEAPKHGVTEFASRQMGLIRTMLENKKPAGNYWAHEVLQKAERGERITAAALQLARVALRKDSGQEPMRVAA